MKMRRKLLTAALVMTFALGGAFTAQAMPGDVGGTWNGDPVNVGQPQDLYWDGHVAHWSAVANAMEYEVQLYRNGSLDSTDTTSHTEISYKTLMQNTGEYTFRVRGNAADGTKGSWSDFSDMHHVSGYDSNKDHGATYEPSQGPGANPYSPATAQYGWVRSSDGFFWLWKDSDGSYARSTFRTIDGNTYYFDGNGYMFTGWLSLNDQTYYFFDNGTMAVGDQDIEGTGYCRFSSQPGPNYGARIG